MKRKRRTEILVHSSSELPTALAEEILNQYEVKVVEEPNGGLVMVKTRESAKKSLFYIGEVFVTECKVHIGDYIGVGVIAGHEETRAFDLAVIDAAYNAGLKETERWQDLLLQEEAFIEKERAARMAQVLKTKVNFETMDVE